MILAASQMGQKIDVQFYKLSFYFLLFKQYIIQYNTCKYWMGYRAAGTAYLALSLDRL